MIRQHLFDRRAPADPMFRWRGGEISRLEGLSDAVFALALTLMIVSVEGGVTFRQIYDTFIDIPAYVASFSMLVYLWYVHYNFFRRYGLEDAITIVLNLAFLFLVLFYALPLHFLATMLWKLALGDRESLEALFLENGQWIHTALGPPDVTLILIYGVGFVCIFTALLLMTWRAYRLREPLELDALEVHLTKMSATHHGIMVGVGLLSLGVAVTVHSAMWAGMTYCLLWPLQMFCGIRGASKAERLREELAAPATAP